MGSDRIYYYLLVQYFSIATLRWEPRATFMNEPPPMRHDWLCGARDVEMEVERYRAKPKGGSVMPMTYALVALQEINGTSAKSRRGSDCRAVGAGTGPNGALAKRCFPQDVGRVIDRIRKELLEQMREGIGTEHCGDERARTAGSDGEQIIAAELKRRR